MKTLLLSAIAMNPIIHKLRLRQLIEVVLQQIRPKSTIYALSSGKFRLVLFTFVRKLIIDKLQSFIRFPRHLNVVNMYLCQYICQIGIIY